MDARISGTVIRKAASAKPSNLAAVPKPKRDKSGEKPVTRVHCKVINCRYSTPHPKDLVRHMRKHNGEKPFSCDQCPKNFSRQDKLKQHKRTHEGNKVNKCSQCSYSCVEASSMKRHQRMHSDEKPFICQLCPFKTKNSVELTIHTRFHTDDSPYQCTIDGCSKAFKTPSDLLRHSRSRTHSGLRPYACQKCKFRSALRSNLLAHIKKLHEEIPPSTVITANPGCQEPCFIPNKTVSKPKPTTTGLQFDLACKSCSYKCDTIKSFKIHMTKKHHAKIYPELEEFEKIEKLARTSKLRPKKVKVYTFTKMFKCSNCQASFVSAESLKCHMKQHVIPAPRPVPRFQLLSPNPVLPPDEEPISVPPEIDHRSLEIVNPPTYYQFQTNNALDYSEPPRFIQL